MTTAHPTRPARLRRALTALAALALSASAVTGTAAAAPGSGEVSLALKQRAGSSLQKQGVTVTYKAKAGKSGKTRRAARRSGRKARTRTLTLPVVDVELGTTATVETGGALLLASNGRRARLTGLTLSVGAQRTAVSAALGRRTLVFFRSKGASKIEGLTVKLSGARLSLTGKGARALRKRLGLEKLAAGPVGALGIDASQHGETKKDGGPSAPGPKDPDPGPKDPDPVVDPFAATCNVPAGDDAGFGQAPTDPGPLDAEPVLTDPFPVADGTADWGFKASFRGYVLGSQGPGSAGSISALNGAADNGDGTFEFSGDGEYVRHRTAADDQLLLDGEGTLLFCKAAHSFHVALEDPTVVLDGADSRLVVDAGLNRGGTWGGFRRADFASLDLKGVRPTYSADGKTATWAGVPAKLTADGAAVTGLYPAGTALDPVTVSAAIDSVPDLYSDTCGPFGNPAANPGPELPEAPAALPDLSGGVATDGGSVAWGVHTPFRNQILANTPPGSAGTLQVFEGATYADPQFTYPAESGLYDAGTADPADDRLVLNAGGIALLCKPGHGYRYAISNPTVVIDETSSRLVVDMDLRINGLIDPSVRSDFATLDMTGIVPAVNGDTITWTGIPVTLTQNGSEAINNRYPAGTALDPITVSASLP